VANDLLVVPKEFDVVDVLNGSRHEAFDVFATDVSALAVWNGKTGNGALFSVLEA
jgi:hypothetical protein